MSEYFHLKMNTIEKKENKGKEKGKIHFNCIRIRYG